MSALLAALPLLVLSFVAVNALTWRRPRPIAGARVDGVRVLIPARNEAQRIGPALDAAVAQAPVTVLDDRSTDATAAVARAAGADVRSGEPLPPDWVGKPWAVHQLGEGCAEDVLLFLDADVVLMPGAVAAIVAELDTVDVLTAVPRQDTRTFAEALVLPLLVLTYTAWLPLALIERTRDPRVLAANGQVLALRRSTWRALGGFSPARNEVVDDMAFCRAAKERGLRVRFVDGHHLATARMYEDFRTVVRGFSKNVYEGLGGPFALLVALALYLAAFVAPWVALPLGLALEPTLVIPASVGVAANLLTRALLAVRHGHRPVAVLLHPVAVLVLCGIALNSWRWSRRSEITWAGRVYRARSERA